MSFSLILPCAGSGTRFGVSPKQLQDINGAPVFIRSLQVFHGLAAEIIIPCQRAMRAEIEAALQRHNIEATCIDGGRDRLHTVYLGLKACAADSDFILVHDAVRPCVSKTIIDNCLTALEQGHDAVVAAIPCTDTLKRSSASGRHCIATVDRSGLYQAQTPQGFRRTVMLPLYEAAINSDASFTDDVSLCETNDIPVTLVAGSRSNIKVTYAEDLVLAAALLKDS